MKGLIKTKQLSELLGTSKKQLLERATRESWPAVQKGNALLWVENRLPLDVRFTLAAKSEPEERKAESEKELAGNTFLNANEGARQTAIWRAALVSEFMGSGMKMAEFVAGYNSGGMCAKLFEKLGRLSISTMYRWVSDFKSCGASGVVPKYGMSRMGAGESLTDTEKDLLKMFWLKSTQPSAKHAYLLMRANVEYSKCSYQTALRFLQSIPPTIRDYYRIGASRWENAYLPYVEQSIEMYMSMDTIVSDHHCLDCVCMYHGKLIRPWITTFQDYRSGKILGWCPTVKPSSLSIIVAFYMAVIRYGVPTTAIFDNGQDYHSKLLDGYTTTAIQMTPEGIPEEVAVEFQGIFKLIGTDVHFTHVYNGKSKGRQERYFRILGEYLAKDFGTYVGSDSRTRPEEADLMWRGINGLEKRNDIPDWKDFVNACNNMVMYINDNFQCEGKGMEGKTRSQVFNENLPKSIRHVSKEELSKALYFGDIRKCGRNGVKVNSTNYWCDALVQYSGQQVRVHTSLITDESVECYTVQGSYIGEAKADWFKETGKVEDAIEVKAKAKKLGLQLIAEHGVNETMIAPEKQSFIDVTAAAYDNTRILPIDEQLGLPMAAGAENENPPATKQPAKKKYKDEFDADAIDYLQ